MRKYTDDVKEAQSIMAWMDRRLEVACEFTFPLYVGYFKKMWLGSFGSLDSVPQKYKEKLNRKYEELKRKEEQT
jgi:hypothetical protein